MLPDLKDAINALQNNDTNTALSFVGAYFDACVAPSQIDDGARFLIANQKSFIECDKLGDVMCTLQRAVSQKMLALGETPDAFYAKLFHIASSCEPDALISDTIFLLRQHYAQLDISGTEALIVRNLLFVLGILNGNKDAAFDEYFTTTIVTRIDLLGPLSDGTGLFMELLQNFNLPFERLESIYKTIFDPECFFSLDKIQRRSIFAWSFHCVWNTPVYFNNLQWIKLYESWLAILLEYLRLELIDEAMYLHFYMHHKMGNSAQEAWHWQKFNDEVEMPCSIAYANYAKKLGLPDCKNTPSSGIKKIAFLKDRVVMNSPFKVEYSLIKALKESEDFNSKYDVSVYSMNYFEKSHDGGDAIKMLQDIGVPLFSPAYLLSSEHYYVNHLQKALTIREAIIKDSIDILVAPTNNYAIASFLLGSRVAPRQIYWSHGSAAYDVPGIDERISHCSLAENKFDFKAFAVPMDVETFYNPFREPRDIARERAKYPQDVFILGTIGRLVKVDSDEYLETIAKIMQQNPNTIYIAAGAGDMQTIRKKVELLGISDRFYMPGHVDAHIYGHIIDLFADTFPMPQGESLYEFMFKCNGKTFVSLKDESYMKFCNLMENDIALIEDALCCDKLFLSYKKYINSYQKEFIYKTYMANNIDEYVKLILNHLADDKLRVGINYCFIEFIKHQNKDNMNRLVDIL